jgi:hypothetical protein
MRRLIIRIVSAALLPVELGMGNVMDLSISFVIAFVELGTFGGLCCEVLWLRDFNCVHQSILNCGQCCRA